MRQTIVTTAGLMLALSFTAWADENQPVKRAMFFEQAIAPAQSADAAPEGEAKPAAEAKPVEPLTPEAKKEAEALIAKLGDNAYKVRNDAFEALEKMGPSILPVLKEHADSDDLEVSTRIARLIETLESGVAQINTGNPRQDLLAVTKQIQNTQQAIAGLEDALVKIKEAGGDDDRSAEVLAEIENNQEQLRALMARQNELRRAIQDQRGGRVIIQEQMHFQAVPLNVAPLQRPGAEREAKPQPKDDGGADAGIRPLGDDQKKEALALIEQLGHDDFATREKATEKLLEMGRPVVPLLNEHRQSPDIEVRNRVAQLIERLEGQAARNPGDPNVIIEGNEVRIEIQAGEDQDVEGVLPGGGVFRIQVGGGAVVRPARPAEEQNEEDGVEPKK